MVKIMLILKLEIYALISRGSFWFGALGVPIIAFAIYGGVAWINHTQQSAPAPMKELEEFLSPSIDPRPQGYVDRAGLILDYPDGFLVELYIDYANEKDAQKDLESGSISAYYVIPEDYIQTGLVSVYTQSMNVIAAYDRSSEILSLIDYNLLASDDTLSLTYIHPLKKLEKVYLFPPAAPERDKENLMTLFLPYGVMMIFYTSILGSSGLLLNSVAKEKETRILEILMVSTNARDLLIGKIIGLGIVGLFQMLLWAISSYALLRLSGQTFNLTAEFQLPPSIIGWGLVYFVLGYIIYAALMAGVGALVPNLREASQATTIMMLPMMIPLFLVTALIESPNGILSTVLSIFPFTAPTTMMLRLSASPNVPLWQLLLSIFLLIITSYLTIYTISKFFSAQTMLSGQKFNLKRLVLSFVGKAS